MANSHNNRNKGDNDNSMVIAMTKSLEKETERVQISVDTAESFQKQSLDCRNSMMDLARSYEHKLSRIENRLDDILQTLLQDNDYNNNSKSAYDVVGETLSEFRIVKKRIQK